MALPDERFKGPIKSIVRDLARGNYQELEADRRSGRSTAEGLREAVERYGGTLVELPDEAFDWMDEYPREGREGVWALDLPLYTEEEGQSDLTLIREAEATPEDVRVHIRSLRVL